MAINVVLAVLEQPYGNPGSAGEPLGIWSGAANITGDATGGTVQAHFVPRNPSLTPTLPDARREFVYFTDGATAAVTVSVGPASLRVEYLTHWARANVALTDPSRHIFTKTMINVDGEWSPNGEIYDGYVARFPQFWSPQDLEGSQNDLVFFRQEINELNALYQYRCWGRYYDKQILANRGFGRLVSPAAVSQFA